MILWFFDFDQFLNIWAIIVNARISFSNRIPNIECLKNCNLSRLKISKARNIFLLFVDWNKIEFIHTCFQIMNIDINDIFISIKYAWFNERLIKSTDIWFKWTKSLDFLYTKEFNYNLFKYNDCNFDNNRFWSRFCVPNLFFFRQH